VFAPLKINDSPNYPFILLLFPFENFFSCPFAGRYGKTMFSSNMSPSCTPVLSYLRISFMDLVVCSMISMSLRELFNYSKLPLDCIFYKGLPLREDTMILFFFEVIIGLIRLGFLGESKLFFDGWFEEGIRKFIGFGRKDLGWFISVCCWCWFRVSSDFCIDRFNFSYCWFCKLESRYLEGLGLAIFFKWSSLFVV